MPDKLTPIDAAYDADSRSISWKADIYLHGNNRPPLTVEKSNYIIDVSLLEETSADSDTPFGDVTANEITLTLFNDNGIFSPTNTKSKYYGYMRKGVKIDLFSSPSEAYSYHQLGTFYVTQWTATVTGTIASITAADKLYNVFDTPPIKLPVKKNVTYKSFFDDIFTALNVLANTDEASTRELLMAYDTFNNKTLLSKLSIGSMSDCFCDHTGTIVVKSLLKKRELRATLTDDSQIIDVEATNDITTDFDGASVTCNIPTESTGISVFSIKDFVVPSGTFTHSTLKLSTVPLVRLLYASLIGSYDATIEDISATSLDAVLTTNNNLDTEVTLDLDIHGTTVDVSTTLLSDSGESLLEVDNEFVQNIEYAITFKQMLQRFVDNDTPTLVIKIRGNPLLELGDKVRVVSAKYNLDYTGLILRQEFMYTGALSCTLTLLNAEVLEASV